MSADALHPVINLDALQARPIAALRAGAPEKYQGSSIAPISPRIGAQQLGCNLTLVPPGKCAFPAHNHYGNEEMFFVLEGTGEVRIGEQRHPIRAGDVIACPPGGPETAHQIRNTGTTDLKYLAVSTNHTPDFVQYPDSGKTGAAHFLGRDEHGVPRAIRLLGREKDNLDYWDGE
jgi:uncharacterized cupin superfamily protein